MKITPSESRVILPKSLLRLAVQTVLHRPWQSVLMLLGIALGVAVMVSIDLANASASRAFDLSTEVVTGKATHQVIPSGDGLEEQVYTRLRREGVIDKAAPVVTGIVSLPALSSQPFQILGIDPIVDGDFRDYWLGQSFEDGVLQQFLTRPGSVMILDRTAAEFGLLPGDVFVIEADGRRIEVVLIGLVRAADRLAERSLEGLILADLATAQEVTGKIGKLDRIDLILPDGDSAIEQAVRSLLPPAVSMEQVEARQGTIREMAAAFQLNLSALSMLALVVGLFLIYNTMTFSVVQRRDLFGSLRCLGVTRREIFLLVAGEALLVGLAGSLLGIGLGILLGRNTVAMVSQTINDLYFTTTVRSVALPVASLVKGGVLGLAATIAAAVPPALEAASVAPRMALSRSSLEGKARSVVGWLALAGVILAGIGILLFQVPSRSLIFGFGGTFLMVIGLALMSALFMRAILQGITPLSGLGFGFIGRMAPKNLLNTLSRTAVAVSALMVAVAVTIGVGVMIDSFRFTVTQWLEQTLQSDVYISVPGFTANSSLLPIDPQVMIQLQAVEGIERIDTLRAARVMTQYGEVYLSATHNPDIGAERIFKTAFGSDSEITAALQEGGVIVSEPLANRWGIQRGDEVVFRTPKGDLRSPVIGVFFDYASSEGSMMVWQDVYREWWQDNAVTAIGVRLKPGTDADQAATDIRQTLRIDQNLAVRANAALRQDVMEVFDRTFAITAALRILATVVAFIGVLSTLLLLQIEKQRETGVLKALGLTGKELWRLVLLETGWMGLTAGILAAPTGYILALILIEVINLRSFGWTIQLQLNPMAFLFAIGIALGAALLAGVIPAIRMGRMSAAEAIRYE